MIATHTISAMPNGEACLLTTGNQGVLVDSGYACGSDTLARQVKDILGGRPLAAVLLTHSHYDHVSGCPAIKKLYPHAKVAASALTAQLLQKEKVLQTIRHLNQVVGRSCCEPYHGQVDDPKVDIALADGEVIQLGDWKVTAIETPGHTRCCMSYYIQDEGLLVTSESTGVWMDGKLQPGFIVSNAMALASIEQCAALAPERIIVPHCGELEKSAAKNFFPQAREAVHRAVAFLRGRLDRGQGHGEIVEAFIKEYYGVAGLSQEAVSLNTNAMVAKFIEQEVK